MALYWFVVLPLMIALVSYLSNSKRTKVIVLFIQVAFLFFRLSTFIDVRTNGTNSKLSVATILALVLH